MYLSVITPEKKLHESEIDEVIVPTITGEITILPHHINLFTEIAPGELVIKHSGKTSYLGVSGGFLEVANNKVNVLADYAVESESIAVEKAMEAQKRAEELKKKMAENISEQDLAIAAGELRRSLMELHVANRRRRRNI